jgi:hypothetical protein
MHNYKVLIYIRNSQHTAFNIYLLLLVLDWCALLVLALGVRLALAHSSSQALQLFVISAEAEISQNILYLSDERCSINQIPAFAGKTTRLSVLTLRHLSEG